MKSNIIMLMLAFLFIGCSGPVQPHPTPIVTDTAICVDVEAHLNQMCQADPVKNDYCCQVVAPTKKGKPFTQVCIEKQNQGVFFNPRCLAAVNSCNKIDACTKSE